MANERTDAEIKAYNLHCELRSLLDNYKEMARDTNSEPLFDEDPAITRAERALYDNKPSADWEPVVEWDNRERW